MSTAAPESIIRKIQDLLTLAKSDNLNEATTAAGLAEAMIQRHRLTMADVVAASGERAEQVGEGEPLMRGARFALWKQRLAEALSARYGCFLINDCRTRGDHALRIVGVASDMEIVRYMLAWIGAEISRLAGAEHGMSAKNSFCNGAVTAIRQALEAAKKDAEADHARTQGTGAAIVLASRYDEAARWFKRFGGGGRITYDRTPIRGDAQAYERGLVVGGAIHLGQALPGGPRALPAGPGRS